MLVIDLLALNILSNWNDLARSLFWINTVWETIGDFDAIKIFQTFIWK